MSTNNCKASFLMMRAFAKELTCGFYACAGDHPADVHNNKYCIAAQQVLMSCFHPSEVMKSYNIVSTGCFRFKRYIRTWEVSKNDTSLQYWSFKIDSAKMT